MRRAHAGMTMIELIIVMIIMGVLASVAIPRLTDRRALQERGLVDEVRALLRHGRKVALAQRREVCVLFAPAQVRAVYAVSGAACNPAAPVAMPGRNEAFVIDVPTGITVGGAALVRFTAAGQPTPNLNQVVNIGANALTVSRETGIVF
jgi:MSHA pilin protein MshC